MSIWGVSNAFPLPRKVIPAGDVVLASGVETVIATVAALSAPRGGNAYPRCDLSLYVTLGAAAPSALVIAARVVGGADFDTFAVPPALLVNSATIYVSCFLIGTSARDVWQNPGQAIEITGKATAQAATALLSGFSGLTGIHPGDA
jgi:hypothetical protein